jgi:3',5'-cyclic-AMP phosphodiesterase
VQEANPATFVTAGHSHRHRARSWNGIPITDVGSTKDHPGVWGAYTVHADGIRQSVRRISEPGVIAWTERTADVLFGQWGRWSPGRLHDRCITHRWPDR